MEVVAARFGNDVDHASRGMAELRFVSGGDDLEFRNGVLVELRGGATIELILVGEPINEKTSVISALAKDRRRVVTVGVSLPIDGNAWDKLQQVQIISAVDGHVNDIARHDRSALRRTLRLQ